MPPLAADLTLEQREAVIAFARTLRLGAQAVEVAQGPTPALTEAAAAPLSTQELAAPAPTQAASPATQAVVAPLSTQEVGAAVTGTVSGTVTNSTAGGGVPADLPQPAHFSADGQSRCRRRPAPSARAAATLRDVPYPRDAHTSSPLPRRRPYNSEVVDGDPASRSLTPISILRCCRDPADHVNGILMMSSRYLPGRSASTRSSALPIPLTALFCARMEKTPRRSASPASRAVYQDFLRHLPIFRRSRDFDTQRCCPRRALMPSSTQSQLTDGQLAQSLSYPLNGRWKSWSPATRFRFPREIRAPRHAPDGDRSFTSLGAPTTVRRRPGRVPGHGAELGSASLDRRRPVGASAWRPLRADRRMPCCIARLSASSCSSFGSPEW